MKSHSRQLRLERLEDRTVPSAPGDIDWLRQFGTYRVPDHLDPARSVAADGNGNVYVVGDFPDSAALPGQTSAGQSDAYVRKYDAAGNELWTRQFGSAGDDFAYSVAVDSSGVYVAGSTIGTLPGQTSAGADDAFVRKYDPLGNEVWTRQFGSSQQDIANSVSADATGVFVAGTTEGALPGQAAVGTEDAFVRKYDSAGNEVWTRQFGTNQFERASAVAVGPSGVYVAGTTGGALIDNAFVRKYDAAGNVVWARQIDTDSVGFGVAVDASGIYVAGGIAVTDGTDAFVRKYDTSGSEVWTRQIGFTPGSFELANSIAVGPSGVYVAGETGEASGDDAFLRKYDAGGTEVWTREFGTPTDDEAFGVTVDSSGVYVAGATLGTFPGQTAYGGSESYVRKYDLGGTEIWTRQFAGLIPADDVARATATDAAGNVYFVGALGGPLPGSPIGGGAFVRKYDAAGNERWTRVFNFGGESALAVTTDGTNVYVAGFLLGAEEDAFVRKYDGDGNEIWTRQFGSSLTDYATAVAVDATGVYVAGWTFGALPGQTSAGADDAFVRKFDLAGNELWTHQFGTAGSDQVTGLAAGASGVYVSGFTAGALAGQSSAGGQDAFVRRYDASGNELWTSQFGTSTTDSATGIAVDASGLYVSGTTGGTLAGLTSAGGEDAYLRKYDFAGNTLWTRQFGTAGDDMALGVAVGASGVHVAGSVDGALPGQTGAGLKDAFVRDYDTAGNELWTGQFGTAADDSTLGIAVGPSGLFVAGSTTGAFPGQTNADSYDAFFAKIVDLAVSRPTSVSLISPANPTVFGQNVSISVSVAATDGGPGVPTGSVQFQVDGNDFASPVSLVNGTASVNTAGLPVGPHTITAVYGGDGSFAASTSDPLTQVVNRAETATAAAVSAPFPLFGVDGLTLSAVVSVVAPGNGNPTGTVTFYDGTTVLGTADLASAAASLMLGNMALATGPHAIRAAYSGDGSFAASDSTAAINVLAPSTVQGVVYVDADNDGQVDFGERAVADVTIALAGTDDLGHAVSRTTQTDANGIYAFINLRPSNSAGYTITETQPVGLPDGRDTLGTVNGVVTGSTAVNDSFSGVALPIGGSLAENYNFGELPPAARGVGPGETATIGFWQNPNGQNLVRALNGGATAMQLGHWLAVTFPNVYGSLDGRTNAEVAAFYKGLFARTAHSAPGGPPKVDAQVMATALAVYVTNQTLAGTTASAYGFHVSVSGVGARTVNAGNNGVAFGVADNSAVTVMDLLLAVNARSHNGLLYDLDHSGQISGSEAGYRTMANDAFAAINEGGDI